MINNVSFKGYSNIISAHNLPAEGFYTTYIAMKLDDEGGHNDLSTYKKIRKLMQYQDGLANEDILTFAYVTDNETSEDFFIGEKGICTGEQLEYAREKFVPSLFSKERYSTLEKTHLKIYTFLADLTKRLANEKFENQDENMQRVIKVLFSNLQKINKLGFRLFDGKEAFEFTSVGCLKHFKFQKIAWKFNRKIAETMTEFFR